MDIKTLSSIFTELYGKVKNLILNLKDRAEIVPKLSLRDKLNDIFIKLTVALKVIHRENQN